MDSLHQIAFGLCPESGCSPEVTLVLYSLLFGPWLLLAFLIFLVVSTVRAFKAPAGKRLKNFWHYTRIPILIIAAAVGIFLIGLIYLWLQEAAAGAL